MQKSAQKPQSRRGMESPKDICGFCVLLLIFVVKQVSSSNDRENYLGAPPILACVVSGNDRLTGASRQGWAALPGSFPYSRASIFIMNNSSEEAEQTYGL